jgi:large subunit ribosomal protein L10
MRKEKQLLLNEVTEQLNQFPSFVIMRYARLSANQASLFRGEIAKVGGTVEVVRKRLLLKAAHVSGIALDLNALEGHIGLVFAGQDPIETTKVVYKFSKANEKAIEVIGGRFDGRLYSGVDVEKLSKLPGKQEMRAQLLAVLEAPMSNTLATMEALLTTLIWCLDNKSKEHKAD